MQEVVDGVRIQAGRADPGHSSAPHQGNCMSFNGDLDRALGDLPLPDCREVLTGFPGIGRPGADRLMLFGEISPVAAVPSNSPFVVVRMLYGKREQKYDAPYRLAQQAIEAAVPETFKARQRAYLLLRRHVQERCKSAKPK
jgi:hypothetical protein